MRILRLLILLFAACSCGTNTFHKTVRIGVDTKWYPLDFGPQTSYVNGYTEDLLLEMARYSGMQFELISANWDNLWDGLKAGKYDAVLSSLPPHEFHLAKYDFSDNFLDLGPVLVLRTNEADVSLSQIRMVGVIIGEQTVEIVEKYPSVVIRTYRSIPDLLNAVAGAEIDGAVLARIPAVNFVADLYQGKLKISGEPLNSAGLHLVAPKGEASRFNRTLQSLQKKKVIEKLQKKWNLSSA